MTTSLEYEDLANRTVKKDILELGIKDLELAKLYATLSLAAAIREQTEAGDRTAEEFSSIIAERIPAVEKKSDTPAHRIHDAADHGPISGD